MNIDRPSEIDAQQRRDSVLESTANKNKRKRYNNGNLQNEEDQEGPPAKINRRGNESGSESSSDHAGKVMGADSDQHHGRKTSGGRTNSTTGDDGLNNKWGRPTADPKQPSLGQRSDLLNAAQQELMAELSLRQSMQSPADNLERAAQIQRAGGLILRQGGALGDNFYALDQEDSKNTDIYVTASPSRGPAGGIDGNVDFGASRTSLMTQQLLAAAAAQSHQQAMASNPFGLLVSPQHGGLGDQHMMRTLLRNQANANALLAANAAQTSQDSAGTQDPLHQAQMPHMLPGLHQLLMNPASSMGQSSLFQPSSTAAAMSMQGRGLHGTSSAGVGGYDMNMLLQNRAQLSSLYATRELQHMNSSIGTAQGLLLGGGGGGYLPQNSAQSANTSASPPGGFGGPSSQQQAVAADVRAPIDLHMGCDDELLSDHQILLRKQIEYFEAGPQEVQSVTHGRRREIRVGQVGIRCKHCAAMPPRRRPKGAMYYPASLRALYQAAQNMAASHFTASCEMIGEPLKEQFRSFQLAKASAGHGGKKYWSDCAKAVGIVETEDGLRFKK